MKRLSILVSILLMLAFCLNCFGQGCSSWMHPSYSTYVNTSNPNGNQITTSVAMSGTTTGTCPLGCNCNGIHTPRAYNVIGSTGGWQNGNAARWNASIGVTNTQTIAATPGASYTETGIGQAICSLVGTLYNTGNLTSSVVGFTAIQHTYNGNHPLALWIGQPCRITSFFDAVRNQKAHHAEDVVLDNGNGKGSSYYGAPVYAMEAGTVTASVGTNGPATVGYPACQGAPGNYVKIKEGDGYYTIYFHMKPSVPNGASVYQGQQIGVLDNSGCQTAAHTHIGRKDPNGNP